MIKQKTSEESKKTRRTEINKKLMLVSFISMAEKEKSKIRTIRK